MAYRNYNTRDMAAQRTRDKRDEERDRNRVRTRQKAKEAGRQAPAANGRK